MNLEAERDVSEMAHIHGHSIKYMVRNHIVISCMDCNMTFIIGSFEEDREEAQKYAYGELRESACDNESAYKEDIVDRPQDLSDFGA
jgi:hypothetical protein